MLFAESHDLVWQAGIAGAVTLALAWMQHRTQLAVQAAAFKAQAAARSAAAIAVEVKDTLTITTDEFSQKLNGIAETGKKTHTLCNSAMEAQLRLNAKTARALADASPSPEHDAAADTAETLLREHQEGQRKVDQGGNA